MRKNTLWVGLDTDKKHIDVAVAEALPDGEVRIWGRTANTPASVDRLVKKLGQGGRELTVCYEAGPCGYGLYRHLASKRGVKCLVVAPSMTPRRPGDRVKTNRRDALKLAKLLRAQELTEVWVPDAAHEALRDVVRARTTAVSSLMRCRQHISSFLLRQGIDPLHGQAVDQEAPALAGQARVRACRSSALAGRAAGGAGPPAGPARSADRPYPRAGAGLVAGLAGRGCAGIARLRSISSPTPTV